MLAFPVTICPDEQCRSIPGLSLDVVRDDFLVVGHDYVHGGFEQSFWRRETPVLVLRPEIKLGEMTGDTCHGNFAVSPGRAEVKVELIVLDVLRASVMLVENQQRTRKQTHNATHSLKLATGQMPRHSLRYRGLLRDAENLRHCEDRQDGILKRASVQCRR